MNKEQKTRTVQAFFPQATIWGLNEDGTIDLSRVYQEHGNVRLACITGLWSGRVINFQSLFECCQILGANSYVIKDNAGNEWIELYYTATKVEFLQGKKELILKDLERVDDLINEQSKI